MSHSVCSASYSNNSICALTVGEINTVAGGNDWKMLGVLATSVMSYAYMWHKFGLHNTAALSMGVIAYGATTGISAYAFNDIDFDKFVNISCEKAFQGMLFATSVTFAFFNGGYVLASGFNGWLGGNKRK